MAHNNNIIPQGRWFVFAEQIFKIETGKLLKKYHLEKWVRRVLSSFCFVVVVVVVIVCLFVF